MRTPAAVSLALAVGLAAAPACFAAPPLVLSDPNLPLWEIRPLDRRVYVLFLEGDWKSPPPYDAEYYVNVEYPDGAVVEHRPAYEQPFRRGEIQVLLPQYQYEKHNFQRGDKLTVFVTRRKPGGGPDDQEVVSNRLEAAWPFDRDVVRRPPKTKYSEREPIDIFRAPGEEPVAPPRPVPTPVPPPKPVPPPEK